MNPVGSDGNVLTCAACGSFRHLLADCPDSWENLEKACVCEEVKDTEEIHDTSKEIDVILYTGDKKDQIAELGKESRNSMVLDSACTHSVCGQPWMDCYLDSLQDSVRIEVERKPGVKRYRFGGGEILKSNALVRIPAEVAGRRFTIETDVVDSQIPLLWSLGDMKKAKVKLDLANDVAEVFGRSVNLNFTSAGHYCLPIVPTTVPAEDVCAVELSTLKPDALHKTLKHLHRQFAHPPDKKLIGLLENAGIWKKEYEDVLRKISELGTYELNIHIIILLQIF